MASSDVTIVVNAHDETPEFLADFNYLVGQLMLSLGRPRDARERLLAALEATGTGTDEHGRAAGIRELLRVCDDPLGPPVRPASRGTVAAPPHPGEPYSPED